ncbi:MAG: prolipoprotein diacylglyceryl transferase [Polyangiales bacterium]
MKPELFQIFGESVPAYMTLLLIGFGLATFLSARAAKQMGLNHDTMIDLGLFSVIFGILGARLLHVIADGYFWDYVHQCTDPTLVKWEITKAQCDRADGIWLAAQNVCQPAERDCFAWAKFWRGGYAYYGGLIAATAYGFHFLKKEGFPVLRGADLVGMTMPLGLFFGRMGCFLGGCCFGQHTDGPLGLRFPPFSPAAESQWRAGELDSPLLQSLPVYPTQLFEAIGCLTISAFLMFYVRPRKRFDGELLLSFLGLYAVLRFGIEYFRADDRGELLGLSTSQLISIPILVAVVFFWRKLSQKTQRALTTKQNDSSSMASS